MWGETARGSRAPNAVLPAGSPDAGHHRPPLPDPPPGVSLPTSTRSDTSKSRYWVTTIRAARRRDHTTDTSPQRRGPPLPVFHVGRASWHRRRLVKSPTPKPAHPKNQGFRACADSYKRPPPRVNSTRFPFG